MGVSFLHREVKKSFQLKRKFMSAWRGRFLPGHQHSKHFASTRRLVFQLLQPASVCVGDTDRPRRDLGKDVRMFLLCSSYFPLHAPTAVLSRFPFSLSGIRVYPRDGKTDGSSPWLLISALLATKQVPTFWDFVAASPVNAIHRRTPFSKAGHGNTW